MISLKESAEIVKKQYPKAIPIRAGDFDDQYYIVEAPNDLSSNDFSDAFYLVEKSGNEVVPFNPIADLEKFSKSSKKTINLYSSSV